MAVATLRKKPSPLMMAVALILVFAGPVLYIATLVWSFWTNNVIVAVLCSLFGLVLLYMEYNSDKNAPVTLSSFARQTGVVLLLVGLWHHIIWLIVVGFILKFFIVKK